MGSFTIFRFRGIPVRLHFTLLFLFGWLALNAWSEGRAAQREALLFGGVLGSVLLHEFGHALTARRYGIRIASITMYPIGGVAQMVDRPTPVQELWITVMGPAVNVVLAPLCWAVGWRDMAYVNIGLLLFNMIPAFPMDGGRLLRAVLAIRGSEVRATRIAAMVGRVVAVLMAIYAVYSSQWLLLLVAYMVFNGAGAERSSTEARHYSAGFAAQDAMIRDFRTLAHGATLADAARLLIETTQTDFPVLLGEQVLGLLSRDALITAMAGEEGGGAYVSSVMNRTPVVMPTTLPLEEALGLLQTAGPCALVMDGEHLAGLLTPENVAEFFALRSAQSR